VTVGCWGEAVGSGRRVQCIMRSFGIFILHEMLIRIDKSRRI
jgi:hypothetical protein